MSLYLLLVHHSVGQRLLGHLTVIDFLLHSALERRILSTENRAKGFCGWVKTPSLAPFTVFPTKVRGQICQFVQSIILNSSPLVISIFYSNIYIGHTQVLLVGKLITEQRKGMSSDLNIFSFIWKVDEDEVMFAKFTLLYKVTVKLEYNICLFCCMQSVQFKLKLR